MDNIWKPFLELLKEIYIGTDNDESWVIDARPGHGFTAAIKELNAERASTPLVEGGSTVAAHTEHLRWSLEFAMEFYKGGQPSGNWADSWKIKKVNEDEWQQLQTSLSDAYQKLVAVINKVEDWSNPALLKGTLALLPHAAYHLGAVKQLIIAVKNKA
jgi:hypothetical protein